MAYPGPFPFKVEQGGTGEITLAANAVLIGQNPDDIGVTNVGTNGQLLIGATGLPPAFATLTSTGGSITFTPGANSLNLEAGGSVAITFDADTGSATPSLNTLNILGGTGITTSGSGNTITIDSTVVGGIQTIFGDQGTGASGTTVTIHTDQASSNLNGTPFFIANAATSELRFSDLLGNTIIGRFGAGLGIGGSSNVGLGDDALSGAGFSGNENTGIGNDALSNIDNGNANTALGYTAGLFLTNGSNNVFLGHGTGGTIGPITGSYNVQIGKDAGDPYTSSESSNISINAVATPVTGESNVLRIGNGTGTGNQQLANTYISGINGVNVGSVASVVSISSDHLGSTTITAGTGITVTPGANTITLAASAATPLVFHTGSGDATPAANAITIAGGNNISTSGSGSTVTVAVSGTTNHAVQIGNSGGSLSSITVGTNGQVLVGATGADPAFATLTSTGGSITFTPGANTLNLEAVSSPFPWTEVTGTSQAMAINNGYILNNGALVTATLPSTAALGSVIRVTGKGAGGWRIAQNSGQTIFFGTSTTTTGTGGRLDSTATRDTVELVCVTANNDWNVLSSIGNITVT